jgi:hypothetical protein
MGRKRPFGPMDSRGRLSLHKSSKPQELHKTFLIDGVFGGVAVAGYYFHFYVFAFLVLDF